MLNALLLLTSIGSVTSYTSNSCFNGCQTCQIIFFFIYCTQCSSSRNYNITTGLCDCISGTYDTGSSCQICPYYCQTCNSQGCLTCSADKYLDPFTKRCLCSNGKDYDSQGSCDSSAINYSLIIGIAVGVSLGLSCLLTIIYMIRRRNFRIFDRDDSPREVTHHHPRQNHHIVVEAFGELEDSSAFSTYPESKHQSKKYQFKEEVCSICLEDCPFFMTECGHFFHEQCITVWLKKRGSCPNCNQVIELMRVRKWCNLCKKQLIFPQRFRLVTMKKAATKEAPPIFWPSCSQCQGIHNGIDLQSSK